LAARIPKKDGVSYFASFKVPGILSRARFTSRFYFEGEKIEADEAADPILGVVSRVVPKTLCVLGSQFQRSHHEVEEVLDVSSWLDLH